jgi:peptidoglycan/LPS O-acetylase OafA/YrhL
VSVHGTLLDDTTQRESVPEARGEGERASSYDAFRAQRVFSSLDGLRAVSILAVLWHHADIPSWVHAAIPGSGYGFLGVDLFFVISGFLIVTLLLREREARGRISLSHFYLRRALRIFPLYYGLLACAAILYFVLRPHGAGAPAFRADLPYLLLYLTNWHTPTGLFAITWSLSAEEQFYLLWPPIERFVPRFALFVLACLIVLSQLFHFGLFNTFLEQGLGFPEGKPAMLRETTFTPICLGVLLAHALHHRATFTRVARFLASDLAAPVACVALFMMLQFLPPDIRGVPRLVVQVFMTVFLATAVIRDDHPLRPLYTWRPLAHVGALSYGLYLLHQVAFGIVNALFVRAGVHVSFLDLFVGGALALVLAELSYRYYETPFLRLKAHFV